MTEVNTSELEWLPSSTKSPLPENALVVGMDADLSPIYIGRASHRGDQLPVKIVPSQQKAYTSWDQQMIEVENYEVLVGDDRAFKWVEAINGGTPADTVSTGKSANGEPLYVGRAKFRGSMTPGKIHPKHECMFVAFDGEEHRVKSYEALVLVDLSEGEITDRNFAANEWVPSSTGAALPPNAVVAGYDSDRSPIYVGRAIHSGDQQPVKIIPKRNEAFISYDCKEIKVSEYEVLVGTGFKWVEATKGDTPEGAVSTGNTAGGDPLFVGRVHFKDSLTLGKIHPANKVMYIAFGSKEHRVEDYEVLVATTNVLAGSEKEAEGVVEIDSDVEEGNDVKTKCGGEADSDGESDIDVDAGNDVVSSNQIPADVGCAYEWVPSSTEDEIPDNAVMAGFDSDSSFIYVGRTIHNGDEQPVNIIPKRGEAFISYGCKAIEVSEYEVLVGTGFKWVAAANGETPEGAVSTGNTAGGDPLFVGRVEFRDSLTLGKIHPANKVMYFPFGQEERIVEHYEVLVAPNNVESGSDKEAVIVMEAEPSDQIPSDVKSAQDAQGDSTVTSGDDVEVVPVPSELVMSGQDSSPSTNAKSDVVLSINISSNIGDLTDNVEKRAIKSSGSDVAGEDVMPLSVSINLTIDFQRV